MLLHKEKLCSTLFNKHRICSWFIHHLVLSCDRTIRSSKASSLESAIYCFIFQIQVSSISLKVIQELLTSSSSSSHLLSGFQSCVLEGSCYERCDWSSWPSRWPSFAVSHVRCSLLPSWTLCNTYSFFTRSPNWSPSFSTTLQNFQGISGLFSEVSNLRWVHSDQWPKSWSFFHSVTIYE